MSAQIAPFFTATAVCATASYSLAASAGNIKAGIDDQRTWLTIQFQFNKAQCSEISTSTYLYHRSISLCLSTYHIYIYYYLSDYLYVIAHVWCLGRRIYHVSVNIMYIYILLYTYALHRLKYGRGPSIFQKKLVFSDVRTKVPPFRGICMAS